MNHPFLRFPTFNYPLKPGSILQRLNFFTAAKLSKSSRVVLVLSINNSPEWQINYGTGKDVSSETIADAAVLLQISWSNRSYIRLPVVE
jgi:uncharacterized protein